MEEASNRAAHIGQYKTCELVEELRKKEGVEAHMIGPTAKITVFAEGPAIVLVVID